MAAAREEKRNGLSPGGDRDRVEATYCDMRAMSWQQYGYLLLTLYQGPVVSGHAPFIETTGAVNQAVTSQPIPRTVITTT